MYYDELAVGQKAQFSKTVTESDLALFTGITGDFNPVHVNAVAAADTQFGSRVVHGMLTASFLCAVYGMQLPGSGAIHIEQKIRFLKPVRVGDTITASVEILELQDRNRVRVRSWCTLHDGTVALDGEGLLIAATRPS